jgi:diaminopimelate decarboxylase
MARTRGWGAQTKQIAKQWLAPWVRAVWPEQPGLAPERWGLTVGGTGHLCAEGRDLHALVERWGSPLHLVLERRLKANVDAFIGRLPAQGIELFYSYKTNPIPGVLRRLHQLGVGAEVISPYELWLARKLGVPSERIIYNGPAKSSEALTLAFKERVLVNLNSREEIPLVEKLAQALGVRARIGLRVTTRLGWSAQFGLPIATQEALRAFELALRSPHLEVVAVHAHLGTPIRDPLLLARFVGEVLDFADQLRGRLGLELSILDLGGSLAVPTVAPLSGLARRLNRSLGTGLPVPRPASSLSIESYLGAIQTSGWERSRRASFSSPAEPSPATASCSCAGCWP